MPRLRFRAAFVLPATVMAVALGAVPASAQDITYEPNVGSTGA